MVVKCADFQPEQFFASVEVLPNRRGNPGGKKRHYMNLITAFDIETTLFDDIEQSIMYIWQWQFGSEITVIGRTWEEFLTLQKRIIKCLPPERWLVVYVHNLSYEFQFLKGVYTFAADDIFAVASRKLLKCDMWACFEFRCSYKLTNMSLGAFTRKMGVEHGKLSGEAFDYSKKRYPWTEMSEQELAYCVHDVQGLVEALGKLMARDGDTLQTIPLTSTGYVRRNAKRAMRNGIHHNFVGGILPDIELYRALREAFRGGNTHANRYFAGDIIENVHSADRSSSYPAVMCNCEYPMTMFIKISKHDLNMDYLRRCVTIRHKALLLRIGLKNMRLKNPYWGCPYLSKDKCRNINKAVDTEDNGRILSADYLETTVTDVDLRIIVEEYTAEIFILEGWYSGYKKLPQPLVDEVISYYKAKTELKGVEGQELYYDKAKALLNSLYGMMAQDPVKHSVVFRQVGDWDADEESDEAILEKSNHRAFLAYQWGVWVTAWARWHLEEGIKLAHQNSAEFIYCDTDSVKYTGNIDWTAYNAAREAECKESGAYATDPKGKVHYMGVFESEDGANGYAYARFKTLGAKKYVYQEEPGGETHCTVAGVDKRKGGKELDKYGGIEAFEDGFIFREAGGVAAVYNDQPEIKELTIDGHSLPITPNVAIVPSEYTLGITGEYERIIKYAKNFLDNPYIV